MRQPHITAPFLLLSLPGCQLPDCHPLSYQLPTRPPPSPPLRQLPWVCTFQNSKVDWAEREENLYIAFNFEFFFLSASGGLFGGQVGALTGSLGLPSPTSTNQHGQPAQSKYGQVGPKKTRVPIYGAGLFVPFLFKFLFLPSQLLSVIEDMGKDIRPTYACSKSSAERLKRGIIHARILVRECLMEIERSSRS